MMKKNKKVCLSIAVGALALLGVILNHSSYDVAWYDPKSVQQQEAMEHNRLSVVGPFSYTVNFDGSVVSPVSSANDVRTGLIDGILVLLGGYIIWSNYKKNV